MALEGEAVGAVPADCAGGAVTLPDVGLHYLHMSAAVDPDVFGEVDLDGCVPVTGEEDVLLDQRRDIVRSLGEIDLQGPCAVAVVGEALVAGLEVAEPLGIPPAVGDADLRIGGLDVDVEGLGHQLVPDVLRDLRDALAVAVVALEGEAVLAAPADCAGAGILPDDCLDGLPVSAAFGAGHVGQLGQ